MRERIAFLSLIVLFVGFAVCLGLMAEANWDDIRKANAQQNCDEVQTFTGNGIKETQPFTLTSDTWRLRYNFESSTPDQQSSSFDMSVYKTGNIIPESVITLERPGSDTTYVNAGAGTYYLSIGSANATWTVTVEQCSASAPPGSPILQDQQAPQHLHLILQLRPPQILHHRNPSPSATSSTPAALRTVPSR